MDNCINEIIVSSEAAYMEITLDGNKYRVKVNGSLTWDNRDAVFNELLIQVPDAFKNSAKIAYAAYCEALKNTEIEQEKIANMTEEEREAYYNSLNEVI